MEEQEKDIQQQLRATKQKTLTRLEKIKQSVSEDDTFPMGPITLRKILGGNFLSANLIRHNIWMLVLVVFFTVVYIAFRYQCQQDLILIEKKKAELKDAKYKALSTASMLTERCRESQVLKKLRQNKDTLLRISAQPPYIINIPEQGFFSGGEE